MVLIIAALQFAGRDGRPSDLPTFQDVSFYQFASERSDTLAVFKSRC
jgi:hypothetical protein